MMFDMLNEWAYLTLLPKEIWLMILDEIGKSPRDLRKIYHASLFFKDMLKTSRVNFLFPKVLNILMKVYVGKQNKMEFQDHQRTTMTSYIRTKDQELYKGIWNCRLVSKSWNEAVKKCYEQYSMTGITPLIENLRERRTVVKPILGNEIIFNPHRYPEKVYQFREMLEKSHYRNMPKNPFLGRHVRFDILIGDRNIDKLYIKEVTEILKMFGQHIWYVTLVYFVNPDNLAHNVEAYLTLVKWLQSMPNLKFLCIQLNVHAASHILTDVIAQNRLPKLVLLKLLEVHLLTGPVLVELFTRNCHIPSVRINSNQLFHEPICNLFTNLKGVGLRYTGEQELNLIEYIGENSNLDWLHFHAEYEDLDVFKRFRMMNKCWSETLIDLTIDITNPKRLEKLVEDSKFWQLHLPRLERLSIRIYAIYFLDLILPLQNLNTLEIMNINDDQIEGYDIYKEKIMLEQKIEYVGFEKCLHKSNIWDKLEKLENVNLTFGGHNGDPVTYYEYHSHK